MKDHRYYMNRAIRLARRGIGSTSPNPLVGAVVVAADGRIVGEGYHKYFGGPHAEVYALQAAGEAATGATLYVSLEPCSHFGKTPPCVDQIIESGIAHVVIANRDANPLVNGNGIRKLQEAGIKVTLSVMEQEARRLNKAYFSFMERKRPWIIAKWAQTLDGKIAAKTGDARWISNELSRKRAHRLRREVDAVVVGAGTARMDDPLLTVRHVRGKQPYRVVLIGEQALPHQLHLLTDAFAQKTILVLPEGNNGSWIPNDFPGQVRKVPPDNDGKIQLKELMKICYDLQITSVLLEGGGRILTSFFHEKLVDQICVFVTPKLLGSGIDPIGELEIAAIKNAIHLKNIVTQKYGTDLMIEADVDWQEG